MFNDSTISECKIYNKYNAYFISKCYTELQTLRGIRRS